MQYGENNLFQAIFKALQGIEQSSALERKFIYLLLDPAHCSVNSYPVVLFNGLTRLSVDSSICTPVLIPGFPLHGSVYL